jgi:hypothetical protein
MSVFYSMVLKFLLIRLSTKFLNEYVYLHYHEWFCTLYLYSAHDEILVSEAMYKFLDQNYILCECLN